ncbi:MAG: CotH kinase family protein [Verrucomicrobiia bacterium]
MPIVCSLFRRSFLIWSSSFLLSAVVFGTMPLRSHAQDLLISEFMAANSSGLKDEDGAFSDWIELYNGGQAAVSLTGWHLSDNPGDLAQWTFPNVTVPGQGFLVVFASGKDRRDPARPLHTNFKLGRDGEFLALTRPDGRTVASEFAPLFPPQITDVSYGTSMRAETEYLIPAQSRARVLVPENDGTGRAWVQPDFDDPSWASVELGVGFSRPEADEPGPVGPLEDVTVPGDLIIGTSNNSPGGEEVDKAIDGTSATKYLNFDKLNAGFTVTPAKGPTVVTGLRLTSANDAPERDPTTYLLLGSNDGRTFTEILRGPIPSFTSRFMTVELTFLNEVAYAQYQLLFPTVRNAAGAVAMQIAEVEFLGQVGPAPLPFLELIRTSLEGSMFGRRSSAFLRIPFTANDLHPRERLALRVRYDDGFVAYLNGTEVARANAPMLLAFNSTALTNRSRQAAVQVERFDLSHAAALVRPGANVLAIQGLNDRADSPDFVLEAELENTQISLQSAGYFGSPTPGAMNGLGDRGPLPDLLVTPQRGLYDAPVTVTLSSPAEGATIRYTTDGTPPSATNGQAYSSPIQVNRTTVLRAAAFAEGWQPSRVATHTYLFLDDVVAQTRATTLASGFPTTWKGQAADYGLDPRVVGAPGTDRYSGKYSRSLKEDLRSLPSMSIVMKVDDLFGSQGIYSNPNNRGDLWERPTSLELIDPTGREGFQADAGLRIQGGAFRRFDLTLKKSFRVVFRDNYGRTTLAYPLFGPDAAQEFDNFVLRANSNDAYPYWSGRALYIRDAFAMESARAMGMVAPHTRFVHLYINGVYWGLYNPVERPDAAFSASYYGGDKDTWDAINQDSVPDGNYDAWNRMLAVLNEGMANTEVYQRIQGNDPDGTRNPAYEDLLDVENMIDYMILNFYVGNTDWPHRNWWAGRNRDQGDGFHFYPWDTETALGVTGLDVDRTGVADAVARPYAAARANADFRLHFADRVYRHFSPGGAFYVNPASPAWNPAQPENNRPAACFAALADQVSRAMVGESARWGDQMNTGPFTRDEHWEPERSGLLANFFPRRSAVVLEQFRRAGLYPRTDPPVMNQRGGKVEPGFELALSAPQGIIYYTLDGTDPRVPVAIQEVSRRTLVGQTASKKALVPSTANGGSQIGTSWHGGAPFTDSQWLSASGGIGYDTQTTYDAFIQMELEGQMLNQNASVFIRIPFNYDGVGRDTLNYMVLRMRYDDGFVAFLNGRQIASANAPSNLQWNSTAAGSHDDSAAILFEEFDADAGLTALQTGANILAIHGLNVSVSSSDFLIQPELIVGERHVSMGPVQAIPYTKPIALHDLTTVKTRVLNGSEWSALNEATFTLGNPALTLSELHYHPADPSSAEIAAGFLDADDFEFVELLNGGTGTFDLSGLRFVTGIEFDFANSSIRTLAPGARILIVKNRAAFALRYGPSLLVAGEYSGRLSNSGERLELVGADDETVLDFTYGTDAPWPEAADGDGPSLERKEPVGDPNATASWQASAVSGGSPGAAGALPALQVEITAISAASFRLRFDQKASLGYTVYSANNLADDTWEVVQRGEPAPQDQLVEVIVEVLPEEACRFFRVSTP